MAYTPNTAGAETLSVGGERYDLVGEANYSLGRDQHEAVVGEAGVMGTMAKTRVPFIEAKVFIRGDRSVRAILDVNGLTVILACKNGKGIVLREAWHAGDGQVNASEGTMVVRFEGIDAQEVTL